MGSAAGDNHEASGGDPRDPAEIAPTTTDEASPANLTRVGAPDGQTKTGPDRAPRETIRRFRLRVVEGAGQGTVRESTADRCSIGSHPLNDLVIDDPTVSRFHCEIRIGDEGAVVFDLRSRNGTIVDGLRVREAFLQGGSLLRLGRSVVRFDYGVQRNQLPVSQRERLGGLVGASVRMRTAFALLERAASSDVTVLLEGETGTGKGKAAEAIHQTSARRGRPFIVVDCSAMSPNLLESELFGHERGAFTGADTRRIGVFEEASGGTVFLDEIGELPADLQPKLLRVLENREFRRIGANKYLPLDVRVIAATNRDLRAEVNAGRFRSDLYYRLAVVKILMPPLRSRPEDIPLLVREMLTTLAANAEEQNRLLAEPFLEGLLRSPWPGNVRELRNYVQRCLVIRDAAALHGSESVAPPGLGAPPGPAPGDAPDADDLLPFVKARRSAQAKFERRYLERLMQRSGGKVAMAAEAAGVDRVYLYRLLRRNGMKPSG